jgi:hypothetical protein
MNPAKGKGERYIYCQHEAEGDCLSIVAHKGWTAFNCERCEVYLKSDTYREKKMDSPVKPENDEYNEHISDGGQGMEGKKECKKCGEVKDFSEFTAKESAPDGLDYSCKECKRKYQNELNAKKRNGTYVPYAREKNEKTDRIQKLKESAERVRKSKAQGAGRRAQGKEKKSDPLFRGIDGVVTIIPEPVSSDIVPSPAFNVEKMEEQNRADVKIFARAFMAGLKSELISAMTEQMSVTQRHEDTKEINKNA